MGQAAAWKGARLKRLICLSLSAVIVVGLLFAVAFIMIPSLHASGNECVRHVPAYVEKIEQWWTNVVQLAAKYNAALPEYAIDAEALTEKSPLLSIAKEPESPPKTAEAKEIPLF